MTTLTRRASPHSDDCQEEVQHGNNHPSMTWSRHVGEAQPRGVEELMGTTTNRNRNSQPNWSPRAAAARRLEQAFRVANLRCPDCGDWHDDPAPFGIRDAAE